MECALGGGGLAICGVPSTHSMSGRSLARHVHGVVGHVLCSKHCGTVLSCALELWWPAFTSV